MRLQFANQAKRGVLRKKGDVVHSLKRRQNFGPVLFGIHRAARTFETAHGGIRVESYDEDVAETLRFFEIGDVANVKKVEAAIRENNPPAPGAELGGDPPNGGAGLNFTFGRQQDLRRLPRGRGAP